jgi:hypothetical protein
LLALWKYCGKEETRVAGPVSFGDPPVACNLVGHKRERNALLLAKGAEQAVLDGDVGIGQYVNLKLNIAAFKIANTPKFEHAQPIGYWLYGEAGTGKSRWARTNWPSWYAKDVHSHWFCGYAGEEALILDDVDLSCKTNIFFQRLKIWSDVYQLPVQVKGGSVLLTCTACVVTSNYTMEEIIGNCPNLLDPIRRRFEVIRFWTEKGDDGKKVYKLERGERL